MIERNSALALCLGVVFLASCAGMQGAPPGAARASPSKSQATTGSSSDLLYVSDLSAVYVFSYPQGQLVESITNIGQPAGLCSDSEGDVFVANQTGNEVLEFAHGGTTPISTLRDGGYTPSSCAIDPVSGNLAVANAAQSPSKPGSLAIYQDARGDPTFLTAPNVYDFRFCAYDPEGNLLTDGYGPTFGLAGMHEGSNALTAVTLRSHLPPITRAGSLQWDGKYFSLVSPFKRYGPLLVYRVHQREQMARVVGKLLLHNSHGHHNSFSDIEYWIQSKVIIGQNGPNRGVAFWHYSRNEKPFEVLKHPHTSYGITISVAPTP
jgi:hypothetical protein